MSKERYNCYFDAASLKWMPLYNYCFFTEVSLTQNTVNCNLSRYYLLSLYSRQYTNVLYTGTNGDSVKRNKESLTGCWV